MSDASGITAATLRAGLLSGLIGPGARFESISNGDLDGAILEAEAWVEQELSTRLQIKEFQSGMGVGPWDAAADPEQEGPYVWPGSIPSDGFPRLRSKVRPLVELKGVTLSFPGGIQSPVAMPLSWFRVDHIPGEVLIAPSPMGAPFMFTGMAGPVIGLTGRQLPDAVLLNYTAGLGPAGLAKWPQVGRLVALRASIQVLPQLSLLANPEILTSLSADGLSQSRASGFVYKDLEDRLQAEADMVRDHLLGLWDGPDLMVL